MDHTKIIVRFFIFVSWLAILGLGYSLTTMGWNFFNLGWPTLLLYFVVACSVLYAWFNVCVSFWNYEGE